MPPPPAVGGELGVDLTGSKLFVVEEPVDVIDFFSGKVRRHLCLESLAPRRTSATPTLRKFFSSLPVPSLPALLFIPRLFLLHIAPPQTTPNSPALSPFSASCSLPLALTLPSSLPVPSLACLSIHPRDSFSSTSLLLRQHRPLLLFLRSQLPLPSLSLSHFPPPYSAQQT